MLTTGMEESENCVRDMTAAGKGTFLPFVLHRLREDQYRSVLDKLLYHFVLASCPRTPRSHNAVGRQLRT